MTRQLTLTDDVRLDQTLLFAPSTLMTPALAFRSLASRDLSSSQLSHDPIIVNLFLAGDASRSCETLAGVEVGKNEVQSRDSRPDQQALAAHVLTPCASTI